MHPHVHSSTIHSSQDTPLLLLSHLSRVQLCVTPEMSAHQAPLSLGFSRQEHWGGLPLPSLSQDTGTTSTSISRWMHKDAGHICNGILLSHKKDEMIPLVAAWMQLEIILLSEVSQREKNKYKCDITCTWNLKNNTVNLFTKEKQTHRHKKKQACGY